MSSNESKLGTNQPNDALICQQTTENYVIDRELDDHSGNTDNNWWDAHIRNRRDAVFHIGRLFNQLSWHLQQVLFGCASDTALVERVLDRLEGVSYWLMDKPNDRLRDAIRCVRQDYEGQLRWNEAADDAVIYALFDDVSHSQFCLAEDRRQDLFDSCVDPLLRPVRETILERLTNPELQWAFELGNCVDEFVRNPALYRFVTGRHASRLGRYANGEIWSSACRVVDSYEPGELDVATSWIHRLRGLLTKLGMSSASVEAILSTWQPSEMRERGSSRQRFMEHVDHSIREHLGKDREGSAPQGPQPPDCYVTLLQMAAIVNRSKSTLEKMKTANELPEPDVKGGIGQPDEWLWSKVRPVLEAKFNRKLPATFPADRFVRQLAN